MDKICIKNMEFYGYHGVLESEKSQGQRFYVDAEVWFDLSKPGLTDSLEDTIDYSNIYFISRNITENKRFDLIEALADNIARGILDKYAGRIEQVVVRVRKPAAPIPGIFDYAEVEVVRSRNK